MIKIAPENCFKGKIEPQNALGHWTYLKKYFRMLNEPEIELSINFFLLSFIIPLILFLRVGHGQGWAGARPSLDALPEGSLGSKMELGAKPYLTFLGKAERWSGE